MRSKHLSVRKCIDKKPDKIKGIVCICIILAVVCAGNMIPNYYKDDVSDAGQCK